MFRSPLVRKDVSTFSLPELEISTLARTSQLDAAFESNFKFRYPSWKLTDERLKKIVPPFDESDEAAWTLPNLIRSNLEGVIGSTHSIAETRDRVSTVSGTALLAGEGLVNNPHELLVGFAERYGRMLQIRVDQSMVQGLMGKTKKFSVAWDKRELTVCPQEESEGGFTIELSGPAFEACFRPSTFLRVPRFDRTRFYDMALGALETLRGLNTEASDTYHTFMTTYEGAYNKWMFGG